VFSPTNFKLTTLACFDLIKVIEGRQKNKRRETKKKKKNEGEEEEARFSINAFLNLLYNASRFKFN
jgi:large-conductance mechanosensitive channel